MDLIQTNGQPRFGRFNIVPSSISVDRYECRTKSGEKLTGWRKRLKYKKYKFCSIHHEHYTIGLAIADITWAGYGSFYIYNHTNHEILDWRAVNFLSRNTILDEQPLFNQSYFQKSPFQIQIEHANGVRYIQLSKFGEIQLSARIFCAGTQPLSMCKSNGVNGWIYTQKLMTLNCEGFFVGKIGQVIQFNDQTFAALNDTCGFITPDTQWSRLTCNFWDKHNNRVGLNLSSNRSVCSDNENSLWINRKLYVLPDVYMTQVQDQVWLLQSIDRSIDLIVELNWHRLDHLNLKWIGTQFNHWQVRVRGKVQYQEHCIELFDEYGIFEHQDLKEESTKAV